MSRISQAAINLIVAEEVTSKAFYDRKYRRPEWPGEASGVTIGIGYDVGYATVEKLQAEWQGRISGDMIYALSRVVGVRGAAAASKARQLRSVVDVPWDAAWAVFTERTLPQWIAIVCKYLPNTDELPPDCLGALVSLTYNRGPSFGNPEDRYREMRAIKAHMVARAFDRIPAEFRSMKRLWPNSSGLRRRRDNEARLFELGLGEAPRETLTEARYGVRGYDVEALQRRLTELGYAPGRADGAFGPTTRAAVLAFQADRNLPTTGIVDAATRDALKENVARPVSAEREAATVDDLRESGSTTVAKADGIGALGKVAATAGVAKGADSAGVLDTINEHVSVIRPIIETVQDVMHWMGQHWWIGAAVLGFVAWYYGRGIIAARLADHRSGANLAR